jgi:glycosyltransferase involved in cell wall biosynthesis
MTTICAIVPTFNRSGLVVECLESLLAQTRTLDHIIVVNDGSTDDTREVLRRYAERATIIHQQNAGKAPALNAALRQCTADYVWICDDDDIADPRGAEQLSRALDAEPALGFVYGRFLIFRNSPTNGNFIPPTYWARAEEADTLINVLEESFTFQFAQMVRRSTFETVGGFREDLIRSQDYEMFIRLARSVRSAYVPETIFYQRQHEAVRGSATDNFSARDAAAKWLHYDQVIFRDIRRTLQLDEVVPTFARGLDNPQRRRAAYLQRACIFAQRALWEFASEDLNAACELGADEQPSAEEIDLASRVVRSHLAWTMLSASDVDRGRLRDCARVGRYGRAIVIALMRPAVWQARMALRSGQLSDCIARLRLIASVLGLRGMAARLWQSAVG